MRGNRIIGRSIRNPISNHSFKHPLFQSSSPFSSSSGGRGRGRGGFSPNQFDFSGRAPDKPDSPSPPPPPQSRRVIGHGRGSPILPSFSSFVSSIKPSQSSIGRGQASNEGRPGGQLSESIPRKIEEPHLPSSIPSLMSGIGRGKPEKQTAPTHQVEEENRHIKVHSKAKPKTGGSEAGETRVRPKMSSQEAIKRAVSILSKGESDGSVEGMGRGDGRGRGGGRGRGRGRGRGKGGWEERGRGGMRIEDLEEEFETGLFLEDSNDGEKLAEIVGVENMNKLIEGFEEMSGRVLPSPMEDAYLDALHTNYMIEFEPEYLMGEFDQNPDIDEKPPMPLRDMLEKVKPFIMAYEGIQSQEEWEEAVEQTMKNVPLLKEIVDYYSGPDRVTAKKQHEELVRVAKMVPASAPASVKQFTDRAVLSLQSNPGWGFDKKCQFMDKLVREIKQSHD